MDGFDVFVGPVLSCPVPPADCVEVDVRAAMTLYTFPLNALGWPALAVGNTQIVGRPGAGCARARGGARARGRGMSDLRSRSSSPTPPTRSRWRASGRSDLRVETKPDLTPVSEADQAAEEAIRALVASSGRGEGVLGEEFGDDGGDAKWIVDPIDGTKNYVRGVPVWATLLALEREGTVEVSLVSAPALGRRWWAVRGEGAFANGDRCRVSSVAAVTDAVVSTTSQRGMPSGWATVLERAWANRGLSDFWQHCLVAEGALDVACDPVMNLWDYAAVQLLVEEAGGRCTTFAGAAPTPGQSFVSTNGALHSDVVSLLGV